MTTPRASTYDVIVAGGGFGGLVAGATAAEHGARVLVLEAGPEPGGTALLAAGLLHIHDPQSWEEFRRAFPSFDPNLAHVLYDEFPQLVAWLQDTAHAPLAPVSLPFNPYGPEPRPLTGYLIGATPRLLAARPLLSRLAALAYAAIGDRFLTLLDRTLIKRTKRRFIRSLVSALTRHGGHLATSAPVLQVARSGDEGFTITAQTSDGAREFQAPALILASGGFQGSPDLLAQYLGEGGSQALCRASPINRGNSIRLGRALGAALSGSLDRFYGHPMPVLARPIQHQCDPIALLTCSAFYAEHSLVVNRQGQRFVDEAEAESQGTLAHAISTQPGGHAWVIMDRAIRRRYAVKTLAGGLLPNVDLLKAAARRGATIVTAPTLEALAQRLAAHGVDGTQLLQTVSGFNNALAAGTPEQLPVPRRSHAHPITTPPFYAVKVVAGVTMTYGGLAIDTQARVLDSDGTPIPGLYATPGAAGGLYSHQYGGALAACGVFGRVAGRNAARHSLQHDTTPPAR